MLTEVQAIQRLARVCDAAEEPEVSNDELQDILSENVVATLHAVSAAYSVGARVFPTPGNGRQYVCIEAGTSGSAAPSWPKLRQSVTGQQVSDGTVVWEDDGPAHSELWDMGAAKRAALLCKAEKCAKLIDRSDRDTRVSWSQLAAAYRTQAASYDAEFVP